MIVYEKTHAVKRITRLFIFTERTGTGSVCVYMAGQFTISITMINYVKIIIFTFKTKTNGTFHVP